MTCVCSVTNIAAEAAEAQQQTPRIETMVKA
jgi:hypothetical protein